MEASGTVFRPNPCVPGVASDARSLYLPMASFSGVSFGAGFLRVSSGRGSRIANPGRCWSSGFIDDGHVIFYSEEKTAIRSGGVKTKLKEKEREKKSVKKKLKLLKSLTKDLSSFSDMGFGLDPDNGLADQVKGKMVSEATELLLGQLQQLKMEEKELKRKKKEEKARAKATRMLNMTNCESSLSSSESSDSECGEVVDMNSLKIETSGHPLPEKLQPAVGESSSLLSALNASNHAGAGTRPVVALQGGSNLIGSSEMERIHESGPPERECCGKPCTSSSQIDESSSNLVASQKRIEVCMGGKCKRTGGAALLEEFQKMVGVEGATGCKCMGKCREGPNVRIKNSSATAGVDDSVRTPSNPLCIGVGLDDVELIVANFLGENQKNLGLAVAS